MRGKTCFLDRDGVIIEDSHYLANPDQVKLFSFTPEAFRALKKAGYQIYIVSNQSGVARGYFSMDDVRAVEERIEFLLKQAGAPVPDGWYDCPHHPKGTVPEFTKDCDCRKPGPGLFLQAAKEHEIDFTSAWMIGDKISDLEAAFAAGCATGALVKTGHGTEQQTKKLAKPYLLADDFFDAVKKLLSAELK